MTPHISSMTGTHSRSKWVLVAIALPVGVLINTLLGGCENLTNAILVLMGWSGYPSQLQQHIARLVSHIAMPTTIAFLVLKTTRIGVWLAPNRLALGCLLVADSVLVIVALHGLYLASLDEMPFLGRRGRPIELLFITSVSAGLATLAASTIWHRIVADKDRAIDWCKALLREI